MMLERLRESGPVHRIEVAAHDHGLDHTVLTDEVERWLLQTARVVTAIVLAGFGLALFELGAPASPYVTWEETASLVVFGLAALGLAVAWWWQPAAAFTLVAGVFVGALAAYQYDLIIALGVTLLFMVPAALFLLAWQRTQTWVAIITLVLVSLLLLGVGAAVATTLYRQGQGAAHPSSPLAALPPSPTEWVWSGAVTPTSARVVAKVPGAEQVRLAYSSRADLADPEFAVAEGRGPEYRFQLAGLTPSTRYTYAVEIDGSLDDIRRGTLTTFADGPMDFSIAFGCSSRTGSNGAVFDTIRSLDPDLYLSTGDFHYGDVIEDSLRAFGEFYDVTLTRPVQAALYRSVPIAYVWDDHDFGPNDAAADSPSRQAALFAYRTHVPHYPLVLEGMESPIGQAFTIGRVRLILTDLRSVRDPKSTPDGPGKSMLGDEQLAWFLDELTASMHQYPLVVWVSSVPWIAAAEPGADHWGGYSHERERIAAAIAATGRDSLVMLAGDAHMVAIDDGTNSDYAPGGGAGFPVIQAGALDRIGSFKGGPYSEGAHTGGGQFGYLTVEDEGDELRVRLAGLTWELEELVSLDLVFPAG